MILVHDIRLPFDAPEQEAVEAARKKLQLKLSQIHSAEGCKVSLDARHRRLERVWSIRVCMPHGEEQAVQRAVRRGVRAVYLPEQPLFLPFGSERLKSPIYIAGFGPAGMFAADLLAERGYRPIVLERGRPVEERVAAVERFWQTGMLDQNSNVQFGEGGAGTFSDGKLTTRINDPLCGEIISRFARYGVPRETLIKAKPHIGTDQLRQVVRRLREHVLACGGEVRFSAQLDGITLENGRLTAISVNGERMAAQHLILAVGHSARDTFLMLARHGLTLEAKPFSVGARIEHRQADIDRALYGELAGHPALPPGEYQLSYREGERAVYTFCMCPGGLVVPAASEPGQVVVNGMSESRRDRENANAALAVSVSAADFGGNVFDGMRFQQELERQAFLMAGSHYRAPAVTAGNFLDGRAGLSFKTINPSYALGVEAVDFDALLPKTVADWMRIGLRRFDRKLRGFACSDAVLTGVETRTSSPLRMPRETGYSAFQAEGLYPCGEGPGYAGGIMSAAVDGARIALALMARYAPPDTP
jgi:uncharacterized FAD-dependent dehydrogenase